MASQAPADTAGATQDLPNRTQNPAGEAAQGDVSKNAAKKAAKQAEMAAKKAEKAAKAGKSDKGQKSAGKGPKANPDKALIGIDVGKEEDFPDWYQQVLTKGDMLDYYDVSGCYILKVRMVQPRSNSSSLITASLLHTLSGRRFNNGSTCVSRRSASRTVLSLFSFLRMFFKERKTTLRASRLRSLG